MSTEGDDEEEILGHEHGEGENKGDEHGDGVSDDGENGGDDEVMMMNLD